MRAERAIFGDSGPAALLRCEVTPRNLVTTVRFEAGRVGKTKAACGNELTGLPLQAGVCQMTTRITPTEFGRHQPPSARAITLIPWKAHMMAK